MSAASGALVGPGRFNVVLRMPPWRTWRRIVAVALAVVVGLLVVSTARHLEVLAPSGAHAVGRERMTWIDGHRFESGTAVSGDKRAVPMQVWFPAESGTGDAGQYIPNLPTIGDGLVESGEVGAIEVRGLQWVRHHAADGATVATSGGSYPLVILSPGNATNVAFYATVAEDLASRGYVVVGIDHPFQVAAVDLPNGSIATYQPDLVAADVASRDRILTAKIEERVEDIAFVLSTIRADREFLHGRVDVERVAVVGHSNGGLAAAEACRRVATVNACVNLDGQAAGGPLGTDVGAPAPDQPFLFVTKEARLHPTIGARFEVAGEGAYRVVLPAAAHDSFVDSALFTPSLNPFARTVDNVASSSRNLVAAFIDLTLRDAPPRSMGDVDVPADTYVNVYPLGDRPPLPSQ